MRNLRSRRRSGGVKGDTAAVVCVCSARNPLPPPPLPPPLPPPAVADCVGEISGVGDRGEGGRLSRVGRMCETSLPVPPRLEPGYGYEYVYGYEWVLDLRPRLRQQRMRTRIVQTSMARPSAEQIVTTASLAPPERVLVFPEFANCLPSGLFRIAGAESGVVVVVAGAVVENSVT